MATRAVLPSRAASSLSAAQHAGELVNMLGVTVTYGRM